VEKSSSTKHPQPGNMIMAAAKAAAIIFKDGKYEEAIVKF
jgi:hypothetical protein